MEPTPPQRPIRARPVQRPAQTPAAPSAPIDRSGVEMPTVSEDGLVNLDFEDVELAIVIDTISQMTGKNFVYDDRVRGRVTIVSPTPIPVEQAYTVFESVLQVKGFTTVEAPGGVIKVIPIRDAKETSVDTRSTKGQKTPDTDRFVTRLIPLSYIDAEQISNTLKPLVSKEAALVAYQPTNTIILTDSAANIRRVLAILEAIDVETFRQELALIRLQYADATVVADQLGELFGVDVVSGARQPGVPGVPRARARAQQQAQPGQTTSPEAAQRGQVRIITDERTNSLVALASRNTLDEIRDFVRRIDVPVEGGGRIQVYYLKHADAEELADTLNSLLGGGGGGGGGGNQAGVTPQIAGQVADISAGVGTVTADPATNALVIQASPEGYQALLRVIEQLDIARPQVLVEALIMEVTVGDNEQLGFDAVVRVLGGEQNVGIRSSTGNFSDLRGGTAPADPDDDGGATDTLGDVSSVIAPILAGPTGFLARIAIRDGGKDVIRGILTASANDSSVNVLSAPHILTSDNEEAEILVGDNIPIITSRVQSASTVVSDVNTVNPATSVNVERQDIGVTLRVTPQITEGETMRLDIFQEITALNTALQQGVGNPEEVGPALSNRRIENSVVVKDGETVVIGGLISDDFGDRITKVPWLGDIPVLGWLFKSTSKTLTKRNLLVFLTPRVIRTADDLEKQSIVKREEFRRHSRDHRKQAEEDYGLDEPVGVLGLTNQSDEEPAEGAIESLDRRYPLERMLEIERSQAAEKAQARSAATARPAAKRYLVLGGVFADPGVAQSTLTRLIDAGYEGTLVSSRSTGRVLLELRVGPYADLEAAERAAEALRRGYALAPQVMVQPKEDGFP